MAEVTRFVYEGGCLIGAGEPSATQGGDTRFALAGVLGVDQDDGSYACHMPWAFHGKEAPFRVCDSAGGEARDPPDRPRHEGAARAKAPPTLTLHRFGRGKAVYLGGFTYSPAAARMLLELLLHLTGADGTLAALCDHPLAEAAFFPASRTLVVMSSGERPGHDRRPLLAWPGERPAAACQTLFLRL